MNYIISLSFGFLIGIASLYTKAYHNKGNVIIKSKETLGISKAYINPLLDCEISVEASPQILKVRKNILKVIKEAKSKGRVDSASFYFKDLSNGPTFSINSEQYYSAASLLKLPLMMAYYIKEEMQPGTLKQTIVYDINKDLSSFGSTQNFVPKETLVDGKIYSVEELIFKMIAYSDNASMDLLFRKWPNLNLNKMLSDIGIRLKTDKKRVKVSVKEISTLLRVLYNSSFLTRNLSNLALYMLTKADIKEGMRSALPAPIVIAHKYAESVDKGIYEFHDCGIVYLDKNHYLSCVMTSSKKGFAGLTDLVKDVNKLLFTSYKK